MMKRVQMILVVIATAASVTACKTDSSQSADAVEPDPAKIMKAEASPEPTGAGETEGALAPAVEPKREAVNFVGTPHDEEMTEVTIVWKGPAEKLALAESPGGKDGPVGAFEAKPGASIPYEKSMVVVTEPRPLTAKREVSSKPNPYGPATGELSEPVPLKIGEGEEILVYHYAGEGTCYFGHRGTVYLGTCPSKMMFSGEGWEGGKPTPVKSTWWVQLESPDGDGWWKVDRSKVDVKTEFTGEQ